MMTQIPNFLTLLRIAMVPVIVVLLDNRQYELALITFVLAGITDGLDGWIAKRFDMQSAIGAMLDPIADKVLLISTYGMLAYLQDIPFWLLVIVLFRDFLIVGGYWFLIAMQSPPKVKPILISKVNTFMQIILVIMVLVSKSGLLELAALLEVAFVIVFVTSFLSGFSYIAGGMRQLRSEQ
ncbi:MAG: cardiolipin synthase [Saprospiraceae bacterium]|jgi:cardiolipin synthase